MHSSNKCTLKYSKRGPKAGQSSTLILLNGSNLNQLVKRAQVLDFIDTPALQKVMAEIRETEDMLWDTFQNDGS